MNELADTGKLSKLDSLEWESLTQIIVSAARRDGWSLNSVKRIVLDYVQGKLHGLTVVSETGDEFGLRLDSNIKEAVEKVARSID